MLLLAAVVCVGWPAAAGAQVNVLTNRYDGARSGANLAETTLTPANVNVGLFGKLYSYPVDGAVYAQPLYVSGVTIDGVSRNVVYIATMNDKVYAFDADSASPTPLWTTDFTSPPAVTAIPVLKIVNPSTNIFGNVGVESTPVIDAASGTIYLVARTLEGTAFVQRLHALDITTGRERPGSPVTITGSAPGTALDSTVTPTGQVITFNPRLEHQRAGLALTNGVVLIAWAGHEDVPPYHGWIMGYNATTLAQVSVFAIVADSYGGGIWQGGRAPTLDADGYAYFATGNGKFDGGPNWGDTLLKFSVSTAGMAIVDYFTPSNADFLDAHDYDLSGSGFTLLPHSTRMLGGGKEGVLYLVDSTSLGHQVLNDIQIPQKIAVNGGHVMGGPVFWESSTGGTLIYNWSEMDVLTAYPFVNDTVGKPVAKGTVRSPGHPGGSLTVSANGSTPHSAIVWGYIPTNQDAKHILTPGTLRAYNAETLQQTWSSDDYAIRDAVGVLIKFVPPVVANGKVFVPTHDNSVAVYGLLPPGFNLGVKALSNGVAPGTSTTYTVTVGSEGGYAGRIDLSASGAPAGATVTFNPPFVQGGGVSTMTVSVPATTPLGTFTLTVTATGAPFVHATPVSVLVTNTPVPLDIVVWAGKRATAEVGNWRITADGSAAGEKRLENLDLGAPKVPTALAAPPDYVEVPFVAEAGRAYRLWMRGRAQNDNYNNDSVYVQFDGSVDAKGVAINRIGTAQAMPFIFEDCSGCGLAGWGWADTGYGTLGPLIYFATTGPQKIRIQAREDGVSIDQIVLSSSAYISTAPGATKNDTLILPEAPGDPPVHILPGEIVLYASEAPVKSGAWQVVADSSAAGNARIEHPDAGAAKLPAPLASPVNYFEMTFEAKANVAYHLWLRGRAAANSWANDSVYVQFDHSMKAAGGSQFRIGTTSAATVTLEDCLNCGVAGWGWQDNGYGAGVLGDDIYFDTAGPQTIRIQTREDGFSIDQLVLSSEKYLTTPPGALKNDTVILQK